MSAVRIGMTGASGLKLERFDCQRTFWAFPFQGYFIGLSRSSNRFMPVMLVSHCRPYVGATFVQVEFSYQSDPVVGASER